MLINTWNIANGRVSIIKLILTTVSDKSGCADSDSIDVSVNSLIFTYNLYSQLGKHKHKHCSSRDQKVSKQCDCGPDGSVAIMVATLWCCKSTVCQLPHLPGLDCWKMASKKPRFKVLKVVFIFCEILCRSYLIPYQYFKFLILICEFC